MIDLDALSATIAARLRAHPCIERLYPSPQRIAGIPGTDRGALNAVNAESVVTTTTVGDTVHVEVSLAVRGSAATAPDVARAAADTIADVADSARIQRRHITVRVVSIGS